MNNWPWEELGFLGPVELPLIRQAYAERLKKIRPEENPEEFQRLHNAYQAACRLIRRMQESSTGIASGEMEEGKDEGDEEDSSSERAFEENGEQDLEGESFSDFREWDFERLFAEGEAEERGRRFQRLMELRRKNRFRYNAWRPRPSGEPAEEALNWMAVSRAVAFLEELTLSGAEAPLWKVLCNSELFAYVKNRPDFVFALEDFLRDYPEISEAGRGILFHAYGLDAPPIRKEYRLLYQLLSGNADKRDTDGRGVMFGRNLLPWHKSHEVQREWNLLLLFLLTCAVLLLNLGVDFLVTEDLRQEQVRVWMGEDFGGEFVRVKPRTFGGAFTMLDTWTETYFRARWEGPRDRERGRRGYVTDYTEARITEELTVFADSLGWVASHSQNSAQQEARSAVYLYLPLTGAGEGIEMLEALLSAVSREDWYQELPPEYVLYLCWGNWSFYKYEGAEEFDGPAAQWYYEQFFGPELCRIVLEETGVAASDIGEGCMLFPAVGMLTIENRRFFHVAGTEMPPGKALFHYFLSEDGREIFCVPSDRAFSTLTLKELYRMDKREYTVKGFLEKLYIFHALSE